MRAVALTTTLPADDFKPFDNVLAVVPDLTRVDMAALAHPQKETHRA
jgi:hypothetical protein